MAVDSTGKIFTMGTPNTETLSELLGQLGTLLGVGRRADGRHYLADMCQAGSVNKDALYRPYEIGTPIITQEVFLSGGPDGLYGYEIPMTSNSNVRDLWGLTWSDKGRPSTWNLLNMFNNYQHDASYDAHKFGIEIDEAGTAYVPQYVCDNDALLSVNPGVMEALKSYYPAFQIFKAGSPSTVPSNEVVYNWCGSQPVRDGPSSEYLYNEDLGLEDGVTYYMIPFLSQYKFNNTAGDMGTLTGKKYCLIYKDFDAYDWMMGKLIRETMYTLTWGSLTLSSSYAAQVSFSLSSKKNSYQGLLYLSYRVWTKVNGVESIWLEVWDTVDYRFPADDSYFTVSPDSPVNGSILFSFNGNSIPSTANRIEIKLYDPSHASDWTKSFDL